MYFGLSVDESNKSMPQISIVTTVVNVKLRLNKLDVQFTSNVASERVELVLPVLQLRDLNKSLNFNNTCPWRHNHTFGFANFNCKGRKYVFTIHTWLCETLSGIKLSPVKNQHDVIPGISWWCTSRIYIKLKLAIVWISATMWTQTLKYAHHSSHCNRSLWKLHIGCFLWSQWKWIEGSLWFFPNAGECTLSHTWCADFPAPPLSCLTGITQREGITRIKLSKSPNTKNTCLICKE